jgi:hypothetical protein
VKAETYSALLKDLQKLQKALVTEQIKAVRRDAVLSGRMARLHAEAEVGGRVDDFVATAVRKSTVLFLLRTVFVRVLEDLGILGVKRFRDEWGFAAFREVAPALGLRAYFAFVFRDLAVDFPALFVPGEDEVPLPDEDGCRALWNLWHHPNRDGEVYVWNGDGFDSRFLGDLYQDLDADIRKRYALLQTPRFVEEYILDHTMTPALAEFDPAKLRAEGKTFRVLDPTCGSGHFLIGAFHRLADYWRDKHGVGEWQACERALEGVWGCDINPHAVEIAEFRLLLEVVARTGEKDLERLAGIELNLRAMDSLIPWERTAKQGELFPAKDRLDAYATPKQRRENAAFLTREFHVVVGNPPYITPKEVRKKDDYRLFWPEACHMRYALSAPFAERILTLGTQRAFSGQITANSFLKRQFGAPLIEKIFPRFDLTGVVDTSGAYIPGHGTPTLILFARNQRPLGDTVRAILGKRGEPKRPAVPERGLVWSAISTAGVHPDDSNIFVSVATLTRDELRRHPWSLGGGAAGEIRAAIEEAATQKLLPDVAARLGMMTILKQDDLYFEPPPGLARVRNTAVGIVEGTYVRDFFVDPPGQALFPYDSNCPSKPLKLPTSSALLHFFWNYRDILRARTSTGFRTVRDRGLLFYEYPFYFPETYAGPVITFAFVATHNHFVFSRRGNLFKQSAPAIRLPPTATVDAHLNVLGLLNSSALGFWMKQLFHCKGAQGVGEGIKSEEWEQFYEYDSTKLQQVPITTRDRDARIALARALDSTAQERGTCLPAAFLAAGTWSPASLGADLAAAHDRYLAHTRRMVALQEELDWLTYSSYSLIDPIPTVALEALELLSPGHRPFEIVLARKDDDADDDEKSAWWSRHGHDRVTEIPESYSEAHRARLQQRIDLIESDARLALLETPPFKRRWQLADWPTETKKAAESWLLDRLEDLFAPATDTTPPGPLADPKPYRLEDIAVAWSRDPRVAAVAGVWTTTGLSVDLTLVAEKLLRANALPDNPHRLYSDEGLRKLDEWKRVWALQDQEDAWEKAASEAEARGEPKPKLQLVDPDDPAKTLQAIPLPPKLDKTDFVRAEFFSIRGKLNVPRERFILFADLSPHRYGWNGWRNRDRALAQVEAFTLAENDPQQPAPVPTSDEPRRCGVTYGLWESLPDVRRWGAAEDHAELSALAREACRQPRCPCPIVEAWKSEVLHGKAADEEPRKTRGGKAAGKATSEAEDRGAKAEGKARRAPAVSLAERAWVASLFSAGKDLDAAGVWARHRGRMVEPSSQSTLPGIGGPPVQLLVLRVDGGGPPPEVTSLDEARLLLVLDDLVASGDVQVGGRGKKKRYLLVPRGVSS